MNYKPTFIRLPLNKMAGCPWNLLDDRGMRVAWCGTDNNHEKDGELIANDILNLVAIGEAAGELLEKGHARLAKKDASISELYEALENLMSYVDGLCGSCGAMNAPAEVYIAAREALSKARGEN